MRHAIISSLALLAISSGVLTATTPTTADAAQIAVGPSDVTPGRGTIRINGRTYNIEISVVRYIPGAPPPEGVLPPPPEVRVNITRADGQPMPSGFPIPILRIRRAGTSVPIALNYAPDLTLLPISGLYSGIAPASWQGGDAVSADITIRIGQRRYNTSIRNFRIGTIALP